MKIVVEMPWEKNLSVNHSHFGPGGRWRMKPEVQDWMSRLQFEVYSRNWHLELATDGQVKVVVDVRFPDSRRRDDHNYYKVICDAVASGLLMDDKDLRISTGSVTVDRERPGFTITVMDQIETNYEEFIDMLSESTNRLAKIFPGGEDDSSVQA